MEWLIKILGGYTADQYNELKKISNDNAKHCEDLKKEIKELKAKNHDLTDDCFDLTNENKKLKAQLTTDQEEVEEPKKWYYMMIDFKDTLIVENDVQYICGEKFLGKGTDGFFRGVYNQIWANDKDKRVTPQEFNDEFNLLYSNIDSELIDEDLRHDLKLLKPKCRGFEPSEIDKYGYDYKGHLINLNTKKEVY